jgi:hypothetical protein
VLSLDNFYSFKTDLNMSRSAPFGTFVLIRATSMLEGPTELKYQIVVI